ncbi:TrpB-like pyridoxal phosphate-dependent enzyme [Lentzea aerocolonigenes]|uniref:TrpB-like pyridoxal phosphate-dependent enzyme n=1 Tax=Lentzea aerocolonigenes TaxID=68170 RepID=UPI0004C3A481|nr:TrpB-like pyridoxal phosphate-dependent enzyme [Lentzea aerocolonigenes]MCP2243427.1 tryptophan synthase beta chain [Lentzea aerocolonigenes]
MSELPKQWQSVLPHLGHTLPEDVAPPSSGEGVSVNLPMELVRQSLSQREFWDIPEPVLEQYRRYRPTPLWRADAFARAVGARVPIYVKYEGGNVSGSHKFNTALAQAYYYRKAGVTELVTGTGAGQWGTALAAACAWFGLRCTVFMVAGSLRRKPYRGTLMRLLGATLHESPSPLTEVGRAVSADRPGNSLSVAIGEAVAYAAERDGCAFAIGSGETYSILHQSVVGTEALDQLGALDAKVDAVVGCVGAGSNFGGIALPPFAAAVREGRPAPLLLAAESSTTPKLTRGVYAYDRTDSAGRGPMEAMYTVGSEFAIPDSHSAGLRYHGAAKLLSAMRFHGQIAATAVGQADALSAAHTFVRTEGVLPAPESGHALAAAARLAVDGVRDRDADHRTTEGVLVCVSGHGLLDLGAYDQLLAGELHDEIPDEQLIRLATANLGRPR